MTYLDSEGTKITQFFDITHNNWANVGLGDELKKTQSLPDNFLLISASDANQTSLPYESAKQGLFSYFLIKGLEGIADTNNDKKITVGELHKYTSENVLKFSGLEQNPQLFGDKNTVVSIYK